MEESTDKIVIEKMAKLLHEALDGFRFSFDAVARIYGYDVALNRLNLARKRARKVLKIVDKTMENHDLGKTVAVLKRETRARRHKSNIDPRALAEKRHDGNTRE